MVQLDYITAFAKGSVGLTLQLLRFGPVIATRMTVSSLYRLPEGLDAAGAESTREAIENNDAPGMARMTATLVRMHLLWLVHDIVVRLCDEGRADVVAAVTVGLLQLQEMEIILQINNSLVESGHIQQAAQIAGGLVAQGHTELMDLAKQSVGLDDSKGVIETLQEKGREAIETVSGSRQHADGGGTDEPADTEPSNGDTAQESILDLLQRKGREAVELVSGSGQVKEVEDGHDKVAASATEPGNGSNDASVLENIANKGQEAAQKVSEAVSVNVSDGTTPA